MVKSPAAEALTLLKNTNTDVANVMSATVDVNEFTVTTNENEVVSSKRPRLKSALVSG